MKKYVQSTKEEIANSITHGIGIALGIAALVILVIASDTTVETVSSLIFSVSTIVLYSMSTLYHAFYGPKVKKLFKRFDHISIYILIAGSYAPFLLVLLGDIKGYILFAFQWILVALGVLFKSVWIEKFQKIHLTIFLLMGWMAVFFISEVMSHSSQTFAFVLIGGISYTVGAFFYATRLFKYHHSLWHLFVLGGTICHFFAILNLILQ